MGHNHDQTHNQQHTWLAKKASAHTYWCARQGGTIRARGQGAESQFLLLLWRSLFTRH